MNAIVYNAPPTVGKFMASQAFFRIIMGPVGSGKTTGLIFEILKKAIEQAPGPDGIRRTRFAIVRTTLSQLKMTVLLDVLSWLRQVAAYKVSESLITVQFNDVYSEWYLIPLEEEEDQKRLLSMQLTGAWLSEAIEISVDLVPAIAGRCGRFPSAADGGPTWFGMVADTNAPVIGSDWHKLLEDEPQPDWALFRQPSGLDINAENLANLPGGRGYYERLAKTSNVDWVRRYVHAEYGEDPAGTAVFRGCFQRQFHTVDNLDPVMGMPILIGQDFGRSPCSIICQNDHKGRLLVLEEVIAEDIGLETHILKSLKPILLGPRYLGKTIACVGDPAGRAKGQILEETSFDALQRMGLPAFPAPTNDIDARIRGVESLLHQQRDGGPAIIIDRSRCPMLVRALNGAYRFGKTKLGLTKPLPEKTHPWSDLADGLQYVCLVVNSGIATYIARKLRPRPRKVQREPMDARGWT